MQPRLLVLALLASLLTMPFPAPVSSQEGGSVPNPTVRGPIGAAGGLEAGVRGFPHGSSWFDLAPYGFVEEEYFLSGTAKDIPTDNPLSAPSLREGDAPFTTRMLVYRPLDRRRFNGTVVVEWENVSGQTPGAPGWTWSHPMMLREGYAFARVSAQLAGICCSPISLKLYDPVRYAPLEHYGDDYAFDIFSQTLQALRHPQGTNPLGPLVARRIVVTGSSQSAILLNEYVNEVHPGVGLGNAFLLDADIGAGKQFPNLAVPLIQLHSEDSMEPEEPTSTSYYRLLEAAGAPHADAFLQAEVPQLVARSNGRAPVSRAEHERFLREAGQYGEDRQRVRAGCATGNEYPRRYVFSAALYRLDRWARGKPAPASPPRAVFDAAGEIVRDAYGNAVGGLRLPVVDVPVATYGGTTCFLFGDTTIFTDAMLDALYPTQAAYVAAMQDASDSALETGYLLRFDADDLMARVEASAIGADVR